jgi:glycerophosphoryl diester phosphodiesterase
VELWGADVLETDVHLSRDGELVVIHDDTVDRTTDGTGPVAELTWAELRELDAGARFTDLEGPSLRGNGGADPRFEEVLEALPGVRINVDAKAPAAARPLVELLNRRGEEHRVLVASEFEATRGDRLGTGALLRHPAPDHPLLPPPPLPLGGPYTPQTDALQVPWRWEGRQVTTRALHREAHRRNIPVHVWTVDDPETMRTSWTWGADGIQTDRPDLLARVLHEERGRPLPPRLRDPGAGVGPG